MFRDPWEIKKFLRLQRSNMAKIARDIGVNYNQVQETVDGRRNDRAVLAHLRDLGCPEKHLSLPEDMQKQSATS